jgi:Fe2+ or Zn2+ uptake regulation protein
MTKHNDKFPAQQHVWRQRLLKAKLRPTPARLALLALLGQPEQPQLDADSIYQQLAAQDRRASLGTVYRVLKELEQHQLVIRDIDHQGRAWYMVWPSDAPGQHMVHLICRENGLAFHLVDPTLHHWVSEVLARQGWRLGLSPLTIQLSASCREEKASATVWDAPPALSRLQQASTDAAERPWSAQAAKPESAADPTRMQAEAARGLSPAN